MTNDTFEDQLRAELRAATAASDAAYRTVDTAAVIGAGTRIVRRRRAVGAVGALAAVTAVALGAYAVLGQAAPTALELVPADSTTAPPTTSDTARELVLDNPDVSIVPITSLTFSMPSDTAAPREVTVMAQDNTGARSTIGALTLPATTDAALLVHFPKTPGLVVAAVPADSVTYDAHVHGGGGYATAHGLVPGTRWRIVTFVGKTVDNLDGLTWIDAKNNARRVDGTVLPSVAIDNATIVWADPLLGPNGTVGTYNRDGNPAGAFSALVQEKSWPTIFAEGPTEAYPLRTFGVVVPEGSTDVRATLPDGAKTTIEPTIVTMGGGYALAVVQYDVSTEVKTGATLEWQSPSGVQESSDKPPSTK